MSEDYIFSKYLEAKRGELDEVTFYSFYNTEAVDKVEHNHYFKDLKINAIMETFDRLLEDVFNKNLGD